MEVGVTKNVVIETILGENIGGKVFIIIEPVIGEFFLDKGPAPICCAARNILQPPER